MSVRKRTWTNAKGEQKEAWIVDYTDRQGDRHIETFAKKRDADARHAEVDVEVRTNTHIARGKSKTVAEAGAIWLQTAEGDGLERSTIEQYESHLRLHIAPDDISSVKLSDLTRGDVMAFADRLRQRKLSKAMVRKVLASLGALVAEAEERNLVARNVVRGIRRRKGEAREKPKLKVGVDIPSPSEVGAILSHAKPKWRALLLVAAFTGLRASELRGLTWANVDLKANEIHVTQRADKFNVIGRPKSKAGDRVVPFGPIVANALKEWKLACAKGELDLVFPNFKGKIECLPNILMRGFIPAVTAALGKPKYTGLHTLRHFYASWCIDRKLPPKVIQERLGHATIAETFDTYGHLFPRADDAEEIAAAELQIIRA
jgi:integrase